MQKLIIRVFAGADSCRNYLQFKTLPAHLFSPSKPFGVQVSHEYIQDGQIFLKNMYHVSG